MQIKEMMYRAHKYMESGTVSPEGMRWFHAAQLVIGHNHVLTRAEVTGWQAEWDGIGPSIVGRVSYTHAFRYMCMAIAVWLLLQPK